MFECGRQSYVVLEHQLVFMPFRAKIKAPTLVGDIYLFYVLSIILNFLQTKITPNRDICKQNLTHNQIFHKSSAEMARNGEAAVTLICYSRP